MSFSRVLRGSAFLLSFGLLSCGGSGTEPSDSPYQKPGTPPTPKVDSAQIVAAVTVAPKTLWIAKDSLGKETATVRSLAGTTMGLAALWKSTDDAIASIAADGTVTGKAAGDAKIIATAGAAADTASLYVRVWPGNYGVPYGPMDPNKTYRPAAAQNKYLVLSHDSVVVIERFLIVDADPYAGYVAGSLLCGVGISATGPGKIESMPNYDGADFGTYTCPQTVGQFKWTLHRSDFGTPPFTAVNATVCPLTTKFQCALKEEQLPP